MKKIAITFAVAGLVSLSGLCRAEGTAPGAAIAPAHEAAQIQEATIGTPAPPVERKMRISERFGRSMVNIASSPLELPAQMYARAAYQEERTKNPFAVIGGFIEGVPMGALVYFPWRLFAGLADLATLWAPQCDEALIYPEYLSFSPDFLDKTRLPLDKVPESEKK